MSIRERFIKDNFFIKRGMKKHFALIMNIDPSDFIQNYLHNGVDCPAYENILINFYNMDEDKRWELMGKIPPSKLPDGCQYNFNMTEILTRD